VWLPLIVLGCLGFRHPLYLVEEVYTADASPNADSSHNERVHRPSSSSDPAPSASSSELVTLRFKGLIRLMYHYTHFNLPLLYYVAPSLAFTGLYSLLPHKVSRNRVRVRVTCN
jgi:hypothetical protein